MRLSEWRGRSPHKDSLTPKVVAAIEPVLTILGSEPDPSCWVAWGEDPGVRYTILVPTPPGLLQVLVRVNVPQEGPRASGKLIRWSRVQTGELAVETASGHRIVSFQVEGQVLRGSDDDAAAIGGFAQELFAAIDGRIDDVAASGVGAAGTPRPKPARPAKVPLQLPAPREG